MVEQSADLDGVFGALADPTRRRLLQRLRGGEATVTELAEPFPVSLNAVSKHLKRLEAAGLVRRRVVGRRHLIRLEPEPLRDAAEWVARYRAFWSERLEALEAFVTGSDAPGTGAGSREGTSTGGEAPPRGSTDRPHPIEEEP